VPQRLLVPLVQNETVYSGWLPSRPMRWIGDISYSLYLIHVIILMTLVERFAMPSGTRAFNAVYFPACLIVAASFTLGEDWIRKHKERFKPRIVPWPAIIMWAAFGLGALN
jgi:peptidoglycan/LPS O-acetylase OafA/YrhL